MKTVVITGGTGFIGRALAKALPARNYKIRIFTRKSPAGKIDGADYLTVSFDDIGSLKKGAEGADIIVHLAAALFCRSQKGFKKANTLGTANLAAAVAALKRPPEKFIYLSSLAAGGPAPDPGTPRTEAMADAPVSAYGDTKLGGEKEVKKLPPAIRRTILRPPIVYGKNDVGISKIARWVKKGFMVNAGSKDGRFSFIYLEDLVSAMITAIENPATDGKTYYVSENRTYAWRTFIALLAGAMKVKPPSMLDMPASALHALGCIYELVSWLGGAEPVFNRDKAKEGAAGNWTANPAQWERDTAWSGWTSLEEGIRKTFS